MASKNNLLRKAFVYGGNYGARITENLIKYGTAAVPKEGSHLGHPVGALAYTAVDVLGSIDGIRNSPYYKLAKIGGFLTYSGMAGAKLYNFIKGDYTNAQNLPFDLSMAASLGWDLKQMGSDLFTNWGAKGFTFGLKK